MTDKENINNPEQPHKRRVRYSGKYPKKFSEKYKELDPEKYGDTVAHVMAKGNTPAGTHIPIMVQEILDFLDNYAARRHVNWQVCIASGAVLLALAALVAVLTLRFVSAGPRNPGEGNQIRPLMR